MRVQVGRADVARRIPRSPKHTFSIKHYPYTIQPFLLAPVLPGETLRNALIQSRAVTDPIAAPLVGWWLEHYLFYVKHRDLDIRDELTNLVLDPTASATSPTDITEAGTATEKERYYFAGSGINWSKRCLKRVVEEYFRGESEAWDVATVDGMPVAGFMGNSGLDSLTQSMSSFDVSVPLTEGTPNVLMASDIDASMRQYQLLLMQGLVDMTYDEFLKTYGVKAQPQLSHVPELLRFTRNWSYPTNTVDPADGSVASAVSWAIAERADKDRFFTEPGFVFGVTIGRPKVYMKAQKGSLAWLMNDAKSWLPAVLAGDHMNGFIETPGSSGVIPNQSNPYWVDVRDLLVYGDQFINYDTTTSPPTDTNLVPYPAADAQKRYPEAAADVQALFTGAAYHIRQDGQAMLTIAGRTQDVYPGVDRPAMAR